MDQIEKPWVTNNCSVIPTESMKRENIYSVFLMMPMLWPKRQQSNLKAFSASVFSINTATLRGGPISGNLEPHQDLEARFPIIL